MGLILWLLNPQGIVNVVLALIYCPILYMVLMLILKGIRIYEILILVNIFKDLIFWEKLKDLIRN